MPTVTVPLIVSAQARVVIPDDLDETEHNAALYLAHLVGGAGLIGSTDHNPAENTRWFEEAGARFGIGSDRAAEIASRIQFEGRDDSVPVQIKRGREVLGAA